MSDVKCARMLLDAAERDVAALRIMCRSEEISDEIFGFHVQQAAEKLFKAWIALLGEVYPLTHSIERLFNLLADQGVTVEPFRKLIDYTPYALEFRYTGVDSSAEAIEREDALAIVESLLKEVRRRLVEVEGM
ncbi:MAG: HEPN domain-containing protein [Gemmatimonadota bacterium]|nr:HEPN domain-containing protein [Gemmatimonadota bacterium]